MANIPDAFAQITIGIIAEGYAQIVSGSLTATPSHGPVGQTILLNVTINNTGTTADTLWCKFYLNGSILTPPGEMTSWVTLTTPWTPSATFTMPNQNSTVYCTAGYINASNAHIQTDQSPTLNVTLDQFANAAFVGTPTYPSQVESGDLVTITYPTKNDGPVPGQLWGHLYDLTYNQIWPGTEWVTVGNINPGVQVSPDPTANITLTEPLSGRVIIGHIE